jgi:hypothetical protein
MAQNSAPHRLIKLESISSKRGAQGRGQVSEASLETDALTEDEIQLASVFLQFLHDCEQLASDCLLDE